MENTKQILDRIDFNEKRVREVLRYLNSIREQLRPNANVNMFNEKFRIETALGLSKTKEDAAIMCEMSLRTFYRKLKEYGI